MPRKKKTKSARTSSAQRAIPTIVETRKSQKAEASADAKATGGQAIRETVESLVIAFVLAFLFRTFQAEAFVIPTGSMAPTLMGQHKDVDCVECGQRFKVNASNESPDNYPIYAAKARIQNAANQYRGTRRERQRIPGTVAGLRHQIDTVGGVCPTCRHTMALQSDLPQQVLKSRRDVSDHSTYSGDRILVNKYAYSFAEPERWDVVVFKYPGNATTNYIKRLVGLPNEELRIRNGDLFVRPAESTQTHRIARKSAGKALAVRQLVHDTHRDSAKLHAAGWPLRWQGDWQLQTDVSGESLQQTYSMEAESADRPAWLRYRHTPPSNDVWSAIRGVQGEARVIAEDQAKPELITDFNAYNTEIERVDVTFARSPDEIPASPISLGLHWVGDLMLEAEIEVQSNGGELLLDLVEAGWHHRCVVDLATGTAKLMLLPFESEEPANDYQPTATTSIRGPGSYRIALANIDDQMLLWVNGNAVEFDSSTEYPDRGIATDRTTELPQTSASDAGDLAPVGIGVRGATVAAKRLQVWRDIYYIADSYLRQTPSENGRPVVTDLDVDRNLNASIGGARGKIWEIARNRELWPILANRYVEDFSTAEDQFFVMGDNSAASLDCRLWKGGNGKDGGSPGGPYLERSLLIGKAVCVYWPHSWNRIPGTPIPFPLFPNVGDMRIVR